MPARRTAIQEEDGVTEAGGGGGRIGALDLHERVCRDERARELIDGGKVQAVLRTKPRLRRRDHGLVQQCN